MPGYVTVIQRRLSLIVIVTVVVLAGSLAISLRQAPEYRATARVQLYQVATPFRAAFGAKSDLTRALLTQMDLVQSDQVQALVTQKLGSAPAIDVVPFGATDELAISAVSESPDRAARVANAYATSYVRVLRNQAKNAAGAASPLLRKQYQILVDKIVDAERAISAATGDELVRLRLRRDSLVNQLQLIASQQLPETAALIQQLGGDVIAAAEPPGAPFAPQPVRAGAFGLLGGLILGFLLACLAEFRDDRVRSESDISLIDAKIRTLGPIDVAEHPSTHLDRDTIRAFRILRADLVAALEDREQKVITVTGPTGGEVTSQVASTLAMVTALAGFRVTLVECNPGSPGQHELLGVSEAPGLVEVVSGLATLDEALHRWDVGSGELRALTSGLDEGVDLLGGPLFAALMDDLHKDADLIILDAPTVSGTMDSILLLGPGLSNVLLVATIRQTRRRDIVTALSRLEGRNAHVAGVLLTRTERVGPRQWMRVPSRRQVKADAAVAHEPARAVRVAQ